MVAKGRKCGGDERKHLQQPAEKQFVRSKIQLCGARDDQLVFSQQNEELRQGKHAGSTLEKGNPVLQQTSFGGCGERETLVMKKRISFNGCDKGKHSSMVAAAKRKTVLRKKHISFDGCGK